MADHLQQLMTVAVAAAAYPPELIADSMAFIDEILVAAPDIGKKFVKLLSRFKRHGGDADADAVVSRAAELLRGHPGVLRRFTAQVYMDIVPDALVFVKRVHDTAGPVVHDRFLAVLDEAKRSEDMAADEIYDRAKRAFGPAHVALLHTFATAWLPGEQQWKLLQQQQQARRPAPARQRSRAAAAAALASHAGGMAGAKKKQPRADDGHNRRRRHDNVVAVLKVRNVKKRRSDGDGASRSRAKKPHIGNGEFSAGSVAVAPLLGADTAGVHHAYSDNDKKPTRRRAAIGGKSSSAGAAAVGPKKQPELEDEVRRFRREWEFETCYSKLVATSDRVTELLRRYRYRPTPHSDGGGGGDRSLEALFPLPECREFLGNCYGDRWGEMKAALEAIARRLAAKEEEAIVEESRKRCRHDPGRVAQRLHGLAVDYTLDEERRQRQNGCGGA